MKFRFIFWESIDYVYSTHEVQISAQRESRPHSDKQFTTFTCTPMGASAITNKNFIWRKRINSHKMPLVKTRPSPYWFFVRTVDEDDTVTIETNLEIFHLLTAEKFPVSVIKCLLKAAQAFWSQMCYDGTIENETEWRMYCTFYDISWRDFLTREHFPLHVERYNLYMPLHLFTAITHLATRPEEYYLDDDRSFSHSLDPQLNRIERVMALQYWTENHIDFSLYHQQWQKLPSDIQDVLHIILTMFSRVDMLINDSIIQRLMTDLGCHEMRNLYVKIVAIEGEHNKVYGRLIEELRLDEKDKARFLNLSEFGIAIRNLNCLLEFFASMPVAFTVLGNWLVEGLFFQLPFFLICHIFRNGSPYSLDALANTNLLIMRDEYMHVLVGEMGMRICKAHLPSASVIAAITEYAKHLALSLFYPVYEKYDSICGLSFFDLTEILEAWRIHLLKNIGIGQASVVSSEATSRVDEMLKIMISTNNTEQRSLFLEVISNEYTFKSTCDACIV